MRITGGELGGRRIPPPRTGFVRPTPDAVRESLFNMLPDMRGGRFLDLYAGTGIVGLEALSRGAATAVFVERQAVNGRRLRELLADFGLQGRSRVIIAEVRKGVKILMEEGQKFEVVFADPPYERALIEGTVACCRRGDILASGGLLVLQRSVRETIDPVVEDRGLILKAERRYGDTVLSFLEQAMED